MTATISKNISKEDSLLEDNFLAAFHLLRISKIDKEAAEIADIERRCLSIKYLIAKKFDTEDTAAVLLRKGLENYQNQVEDKSGINNYWQQFQALTPEVNNDPLKWKSDLVDPKIALQFLKPLSCQDDNLKACKGKVYVDGHIEEITSIWKNDGKILRNRKVPKKSTWYSESLNANVNNLEENQLQKSQNACSVVQVNLNHQEIFDHKRGIQKQECEPSTSCSNNAHRKYPDFQQFSDFECKDAIKNNYKYTSLRNKNARTNSSSTSRYREEEPETSRNRIQSFRTARDELNIQQLKTNKPQKKTLGGRASVNSKFVCPLKREQEKTIQECEGIEDKDEFEDERLKNIDRKMIELVKNEIMDSGSSVSWNNIAGLEYAKNTIKEVVVFPMLRPDIFTGLRCPPKGILLFGPPGTGKTLIGKCIASQSKSTFFAISASSLTSKWVGEGEKMVRALFAVAKVYQPAVIFIDEIDSLLSQRSDGEHESSRRIKTEFLVQLDGAATSEKDRILVIGATNRPQELDEAARRRLVKRLYIPLPELNARKQIIKDLLISEHHNLTLEEIADIATLSEGYSGADMANLCKEASMGPIRSISFSQLENIKKEEVRQVTVEDFKQALNYVRSSVSKADLSIYVEWDRTYGTGSAQNHKS